MGGGLYIDIINRSVSSGSLKLNRTPLLIPRRTIPVPPAEFPLITAAAGFVTLRSPHPLRHRQEILAGGWGRGRAAHMTSHGRTHGRRHLRSASGSILSFNIGADHYLSLARGISSYETLWFFFFLFLHLLSP